MKNSKLFRVLFYLLIGVFATVLFALPLFFLFINSFKGQSFIINSFFTLPDFRDFVGIENYFGALIKTEILKAFINSALITVISVWLIIFLSSMAAWMITRANNILSKFLYISIIVCMAIPFQIMFHIIPSALKFLSLDNPLGMIIVYVGLGIPFNVFLYCIFMKKFPVKVEEAALLDGYSLLGVFFRVTLPSLKPVTIVLSLINSVLIWNDFLIPNIILGSQYKTIPTLIKSLDTGESTNMAIFTAVLVLSLIPAIIFYKRFNRRIFKNIERIK